MVMEAIIICLLFILGGIVQGASGFGFGLVVMGLLPLLLSVKDSTLIVIALLFVASLSILVKLYKHIDYKGFLLISSVALIGRLIAFFILSAYGETELLERVLGVFLIGMVIYMSLTQNKNLPSNNRNPLFPIILGLLGGLFGGLFAVGGPFFVFYFLTVYKDNLKYSANLQAVVIISSLFSLLLHGINGDFNSVFYLYLLLGTVSVWIGTNIGMKWLSTVSNLLMQRLIMLIIVISSINLLFF